MIVANEKLSNFVVQKRAPEKLTIPNMPKHQSSTGVNDKITNAASCMSAHHIEQRQINVRVANIEVRALAKRTSSQTAKLPTSVRQCILSIPYGNNIKCDTATEGWLA